jgi:NitT/TauT family transport system ATP-binding protein
LNKSLVSFGHVTYSYETSGAPALKDVNLEIPAGEITAIIGPSGCGKSTLLSLLANLRQPTAGDITWDDSAVREVKASGGRLLTMVFQKDTVLPWLTVEGNVGFGLRYLPGVNRKEKAERTEELLDMGGLTDVARKYPYQLSGGMRRRVAFLAGVAPHPRLLILDEPFSSLDEPSRVGIHADVLSVVQRLQMTVVIVTHDLGEAISLSDSVYMLSRGPGNIIKHEQMPFYADRDVFEIRQTEAYQSMYATLWETLSEQSWSRRGAGRTASAGTVSAAGAALPEQIRGE